MTATIEQVDAWWKVRVGAGPHEYDAWYWGDGSPGDRGQWAWCDAAASKCLHDTGGATVAPSARCDASVTAYRNAGLWVPWSPTLVPQPGWQAFYMWDPRQTQNGVIAQHTGEVLAGFPGGHFAGEGNVGNRVVYRIRRAANIVGYGRTAVLVTPPPPVHSPFGDHRLVRQLGEAGPDPVFFLAEDAHGVYRMHVPREGFARTQDYLVAHRYRADVLDNPAGSKAKLATIRQEQWKEPA